jgi:Spy/CpxP family protein refolding chaperone
MLKRTVGAALAALVLALGGAGAAFASNGADDPAGQHREHQNGEKHHKHDGKHRHHRHGRGQDDGPNHM